MSPYPFGALRAYPAAIAAGVIVGLAVFVLLARRAGLPPRRALGFAAATTACGLLGGRVYAIVTEGDPSALAGWAALAHPGYRHPGIIVGMLLGLPLTARVFLPGRSLAWVADLGTPAVALGLALARVGCFLEGCCYGTPSGLPWAVRFPGTSPVAAHQTIAGLLPPGASASLPVHPLQLYLALLPLAVGLLLLWRRRRQRFDGEILLLGLAVHEGGKALLECLRASDPLNGGPHLQLASLLLAVAGTAGLAAGWLARANGTATRPP
jgi:phosphatidylglycerol:prolipoprotein diacylglycerol transferase